MSKFSLSISEVAALLGVESPTPTNTDLRLTGVSSLEDATSEEIAFFEHPKYVRALRATQAGLVLVPLSFNESIATPTLAVANPSAAFSVLLDKLFPPHTPGEYQGIHPSAVVHETAQVSDKACIQSGAVVGAGAHVGAHTVIGPNTVVGRDVWIGEDCVIHPQVVLYDRTQIANRVVIHSNTVIGSDGFGYCYAEGRHQKVTHHGFVQIDDDVEIGACTAIDRARFGRTWIQAGTKIDNLVQIAHNVTIGEHCLIISQTGIAGSARLGKRVTLAGQVGVVGHIEIGDNVVVAAKSGVSKDCPPNQTMMGMFSIPMNEARELVAHYHRLPKTAAKLKSLEEEVAELKRLVSELAKPSTEAQPAETRDWKHQ